MSMSTNTAVNDGDDKRFQRLWAKLYAKGVAVVAKSSKKNVNTEQQQQEVVSLLQSLSTLLFGLDATKKALVASSALELAVKCIQQQHQNNNNNVILLLGLKVIKSCVVQNPVGRDHCRACGVFAILRRIIEGGEDVVVVDEAYTTLAAVCLGNDLNALQATVLFKSTVVESFALQQHKNVLPKQKQQQLLTYLQALFAAMKREQHQLLTEYSNDPEEIFQRTESAEKSLIRANTKLIPELKWFEADRILSRAILEIDGMLSYTQLANTLMFQLRNSRSIARVSLQEWAGALHDVEVCLQLDPTTTVVVELESRRIDVYMGQGRYQEAEERLGHLLLMTHHSQDRVVLLRKKMNQLQLAKQQQQQKRSAHRSSCHARRRSRETDLQVIKSWLTTHHRDDDDEIVIIGALVKSLYGTGIVQEIRKCGLTKIQIESWLLVGGQKPTAYLMPECYTVVSS